MAKLFDEGHDSLPPKGEFASNGLGLQLSAKFERRDDGAIVVTFEGKAVNAEGRRVFRRLPVHVMATLIAVTGAQAMRQEHGVEMAIDNMQATKVWSGNGEPPQSLLDELDDDDDN